MSYEAYLTTIGISTDGWDESIVTRLGIAAADAVSNTATALARKKRQVGQPLVVTFEDYMQALTSLDEGERERLRQHLMDIESWG